MSRRFVRIGLIVGLVHLAVTLGTGGLALLLRMEEATQGIDEPTLMTRMMLALMELFSFPANLLVPRLLSPATAAAATWLILALNSGAWGLLGGLVARWWLRLRPPAA